MAAIDVEDIDSSDALNLAGTADGAEALRSLVIGHRQALIDAGFSEVAAEEMAVDLHSAVAEDFF